MVATWYVAVLQFLWVLAAILLILIVLIQKGKGGGLSGAFGGAGGHSAFGTAAADVLMKITGVIAGAWIVVTMLLVVLMNPQNPRQAGFGPGPAAPTEPAGPGPGGAPPSPAGGQMPTDSPESGKAAPGRSEGRAAPDSTAPPAGAGQPEQPGP